jgi:hypothetical protein
LRRANEDHDRLLTTCVRVRRELDEQVPEFQTTVQASWRCVIGWRRSGQAGRDGDDGRVLEALAPCVQ